MLTASLPRRARGQPRSWARPLEPGRGRLWRLWSPGVGVRLSRLVTLQNLCADTFPVFFRGARSPYVSGRADRQRGAAIWR